jgi:hypothetical protein
MLEYTRLARDRRKLLALTGLTRREFQALLPAFAEAYQRRHEGDRTLAGRKRKRHVGGGRVGKLRRAEQKLLFILVYPKAYPLQVVLGALLEVSQASANEWLQRLLPVLREAVRALGGRPEREGPHFARAERRKQAPGEYLSDGTERRRQRPKKPAKPRLHSSGKKKRHGDKNVLIVQTRSKRVGYLSPTSAGKTQDKKVGECEQIAYPRQARLHKDPGFQGYEPPVKPSYQPKKSRVAPH